jgi:type IV pilus assembly protein PilC
VTEPIFNPNSEIPNINNQGLPVSPNFADNLGQGVRQIPQSPPPPIPSASIPPPPIPPASIPPPPISPASIPAAIEQIAAQIHTAPPIPHEDKTFWERIKEAISHFFAKAKSKENLDVLKELHPYLPTTSPGFSAPTAWGQLPVLPPPSWLQKNIPSLYALLNLLSGKQKTEMRDDATSPLTSRIRVQVKQNWWKNWYTLLVTKKDRLLFLDQLTTLLNSDIRIVDGLRLLKQQTQKKSFKKLLTSMIKDIEGGNMLSAAMEKYPRVFPTMWCNLIKAGESSGKLSKIMADLNKQQEDLERILGSIKGALVYPGFIVTMLAVLMGVMMTTIVPQIEGIYKQARVDLPGITKMIITTSRFTIENGLMIIIGSIIAVILFVILIKKIYLFTKAWDYLNLRWPVFGELNRERNLIVFADNMQLLLSSGVLIGDALTITSQVVTSINYQEEILRIKESITRGSAMSQAIGLIDIAREKFEKNFYFPLEFAQMINVGERTGNLVAVLTKSRDTYSDKVGHTVKNLSTLLEPIMIVIVGGLVGVFLLGIMLPFFGLGKVARGL